MYFSMIPYKYFLINQIQITTQFAQRFRACPTLGMFLLPLLLSTKFLISQPNPNSWSVLALFQGSSLGWSPPNTVPLDPDLAGSPSMH